MEHIVRRGLKTREATLGATSICSTSVFGVIVSSGRGSCVGSNRGSEREPDRRGARGGERGRYRPEEDIKRRGGPVVTGHCRVDNKELGTAY